MIPEVGLSAFHLQREVGREQQAQTLSDPCASLRLGDIPGSPPDLPYGVQMHQQVGSSRNGNQVQHGGMSSPTGSLLYESSTPLGGNLSDSMTMSRHGAGIRL